MRRSVGMGVVIFGGLVLAGARSAVDGSQGHAFECNDATLRGTYGIQMTGSRPLPGGGTEPIIGLALRTYDGAGNYTQIDNVKGAVAGLVPDRPGFGTYQVNPNCTAVAQLQPAPGIVVEERMVIVDDGGEVRSFSASPLPIMISAVQKRIDRR
jgi:hypothetical protein